MKRIIGLLVSLAMVLSLAGCEFSPTLLKKDPNTAPLTILPGQSYTDFENIEIRIDSLEWHEEVAKTTLTVVWKNGTEFDAIYGSSYLIERLDGEEWVSCAMREDLVSTAIAYSLEAGSTKTETYNLTKTFDVASPGKYRFKTECYVYESENRSTKCELTAEFFIEDAAPEENTNTSGVQVPFCARYVRTDGTGGGVLFPCVRIVDSLQALEDYYTQWHDRFDLERRDTVSSDSTAGFLDVCDPYDETFFTDSYLLFVLLEEPSGSIRHEVRSVEQTRDGLLSLSIDRRVPEAGTEDMAQWHILFELPREYLVESSLDTLILIDGDTVLMEDRAVPPREQSFFAEPPAGTLHTPECSIPLIRGGYHWITVLEDDLEQSTIADQADRPLGESAFTPVRIPEKYAETVYVPMPDSGSYPAANSLGYLLKLSWEKEPDSVNFTCWPQEVWQDDNISEEAVVSQDNSVFYAKNGGYVYEINAVWEGRGTGCHGTASYYVYLIGGTE